MEKENKHIFIHPDHVENLDAKYEKLEKNKKDPVRTGYTSTCYLRNTKYSREILFNKKFITEKMPTRAFIIFKVVNKDEIMIQPCPVKWMNRTHVNHVERRPFAFLRSKPFRAELESTPPAQVFYSLGISPICEGRTFTIEEWEVQDEAEGRVKAYRLIPR